MCGIAGYFDNYPSEKKLSATTSASQFHRGPDQQGVYDWQDRMEVAFSRLAINDLSEAGMQPFHFHGVSVWVNGEIYNYPELKKKFAHEFLPRSRSDAEIIPFLYKKMGFDFLQIINGMFVFVIHDTSQDCVHIVQDRFGARPIHYKTYGSRIYFASELKTLNEMIPIEADTRLAAFASSFCEVLPTPLTPFKNVFKMDCGSVLTFGKKGLTKRKWYTPVILTESISFRELSDHFFEIFDSAVSMRLRSDAPVGAYLSGGLDSSIICERANSDMEAKLKVFNAFIENKSVLEKHDGDNKHAKNLSKQIGLDYHQVKVDFEYYCKNVVRFASTHDEILASPSTIVLYALAEKASEHVKVVLDGVGGDELFGGYYWQNIGLHVPNCNMTSLDSSNEFDWNNYLQIARNQNPPAARSYMIKTGLPLWNSIALQCIPDYYLGSEIEESINLVNDAANTNWQDAKKACPNDLLNQIQFLNYSSIIRCQHAMTDRPAMYYSIEGRSPMLDYRLVELMFSIPSFDKGEPGKKSLLRKMLKGRIPDKIINEKKSGPAVPLSYWMKKFGYHSKWMKCLKKNEDELSYVVGNSLMSELKKPDSKLHQHGSVTHALIALLIWSKKWITNSPLDPQAHLDELLAS
jgi:asparagine synthase (glutamine-hydrolysing)